ncbi:MAG: ParB/RepB/Spo0J family partition protein [Paracoccus sp. (in: a-proteobacteria)]|nr:ParB/RepB/Spo0J family partition protein [Paracoccus sp. (in: a-proteobacteria)]
MGDYRGIDIRGREMVQPASQPAPQLQWVPIDDLVIDDRYQRPLSAGNWQAIRRIATEFRWSRFSPLLVAPIEGGRFAVVDGQHRAHAAALCGYKTVPAMIALIDVAEQAAAFVDVNSSQIRVHALVAYRAALAAGVDWAVRCHKAVAAAGCRMMTAARSSKDKKPGQVFCIQLIRRLIEGGGDAAVTNGLAALRTYDPESVANFSEMLLNPWLMAIAADPRPTDALVEVLRSRKPWLVIEAADRLAENDGRPKAAVRREFFAMLIRNGGGPDAA